MNINDLLNKVVHAKEKIISLNNEYYELQIKAHNALLPLSNTTKLSTGYEIINGKLLSVSQEDYDNATKCYNTRANDILIEADNIVYELFGSDRTPSNMKIYFTADPYDGDLPTEDALGIVESCIRKLMSTEN